MRRRFPSGKELDVALLLVFVRTWQPTKYTLKNSSLTCGTLASPLNGEGLKSDIDTWYSTQKDGLFSTPPPTAQSSLSSYE